MMSETKVMKKQKYSLEFEIKSSPKILYNRLSTASGMEGWFADRVTIHQGDFIFHWGIEEQRARIVSKKENQMIRFKYITDGKKEETYIQFDIITDEITGDIALIITDFATDEEKDEDTRLWNSQIHELMHAIGS